MFFCGPFILLECILCCAYYDKILHGCQEFIEDPMTATLIYMIIILGCLSLVGCLYCSYMSLICVKAGKRALPSMRDVALWQAERGRMIEENRIRGRAAIERENLRRAHEYIDEENAH